MSFAGDHWMNNNRCGPSVPLLVVMLFLTAQQGCGSRDANQRPTANPFSTEDGGVSKDIESRRTLSQALKVFGDLEQAIESTGLQISRQDDGAIWIVDPMRKGNLDDAEFALLTRLPNLKRLWLRDARITKVGLASLIRMPQLQGLLLGDAPSGFELTDEMLVHLRHLPNLQELNLDSPKITGVGLKHIANPGELNNLGLSGTAIDDEHLALASRFTGLKYLNLDRTRVSDQGLRHLQQSPLLKVLQLSGTQVSDGGVEQLISLPALATLDVSDTKVTEACVASLLKIPKLRRVTFGDGQIDVHAVDQLNAAKIEVEHGLIRGLVRDKQVLRYLKVDFEVDAASSLKATIDKESNDITWQIEIKCTRAYVPQYWAPASLSGPPFEFAGDWRELVGRTFRIDYDESQLHPISPDNASNIYVGWHAAPNNHVIRFVSRTGNRFLIDWKCAARESADDIPKPIRVHAEIPFKSVTIYSERGMRIREAQALLKHHFGSTEFGEPKTSDEDNRLKWAAFPLLPSSE